MKKRVINTLAEEDIQIPSSWITKIYLKLDPPRKFKRKDIVGDLNNKNRIDQFLRRAVDFHLLKKLNRGEYFAVDPCTAINCWAVENYYSELLVLESFFEYIGIQHAFLCLSANEYADYVPDRPMIVIEDESGFKNIDSFVYDFESCERLKLKVMKKTFELPLLSKEETAILLMSTYLSREVKAGKEIIEDIDLSGNVKSNLLGLGYSGFDVTDSSNAEIKFPGWIRDKQEKVGIGRLKEIATR